MRATALAALVASIGTAWIGQARAEEAFVTNQLSENLTVVDLTSLQPVATIAIGGKPAQRPVGSAHVSTSIVWISRPTRPPTKVPLIRIY